jgi:uncharacterized phage infection (PIP) family protein YhgE
MLSLDQVRLLENRVEKAVGKIENLTAENAQLRTQLSGLQTRVNELEGLVRSFKDDQGRIEEGILNALDKLSAFEDSVFHNEQTAPAQTVVPEIRGAESAPAQTANQKDIPSTAELDIQADWDTPAEEKGTDGGISPDGQMDIF